MDKVYDATKKSVFHNNFKSIGTIFIVVLIGIVSIFGTYQALIANARDMGLELVRSYTADEERNIAVYKTFIQMGMYYLNEEKSEGNAESQIELDMRNFLLKGVEEIGDTNLHSYAVVNGNLIASNAENISDVENYQTSKWYQEMKDANGQVVFPDVQEMESEKNVFVGAVDPASGDAIFFDLKRENLNALHKDLNLPEQGAYYLCDSHGNLLYYQAPFSVDEESIEKYATDLCNKIHVRAMAETGESIIDVSGKKRGLYHNSISNGWICIMTIPHTVLLSGFYKILAVFGVAFLIFFIIMLVISVRDMKLGNHVVRANASIHALCNTYYAIYRINLKKATYIMLKGSDEMQKLIPRSGTYDEMMHGFSQVVTDEETVRELCTSFSLEHLKQLKKANIEDFGGDFLRLLNGEQKWVNISFILDDALGEDEAMLAFRQIDAEKRQQLTHTKLLETALEAADASEKAQKTFFSNMSHEMRTPLNIILGMNELAMKEECSREKRLDYQKKIEYSGKELLAVINNILEVSRTENGLVPLEHTTFSLVKVFKQIVQPFQEQAEAEGKFFEIEIAIENETVKGDSFKLTQILNNLLSNAMQFTHQGNSIKISLTQAGMNNRNYTFIVEDTGIGMSEAFLPRIFEPYTQERRFGEHVLSAGGLGMSLVKSLVIQKKGEINVESAIGKGTKVIVTLPFEPVEQKNVQITENPLECLRKLNIMVVDDNDLNRELLCELLEEQGANTVQAVDGKEALELFETSEKFETDVIIMDFQMPVMNGCESAACIRALPREDADWVLIVALTANSFAEDVNRTKEAGMDAHLSKPVDMDVLSKTVWELLKKRSCEE